MMNNHPPNQAPPPAPPDKRGTSKLLIYGLPLLLSLTVVGWLAFGLDPHGSGRDLLHNGWMPARLILAGDNPYAPDQARVHRLADPYLLPVAAGSTEFNSGAEYNAIYPYWAMLLQVPLGLLDFPAALIVWTLLSGLLLLVGLYLSLEAARWRAGLVFAPLLWAASLLLLGLAALFYVPTLLHFSLGQYSIIIFALLAVIYARPHANLLAPLALALTSMKPQLSGLVGAVILLGWLAARDWRKLVVALSSIATLYLVPAIFVPSAFSGWFSVNFVAQKQATRLAPASSSWWGLAYTWVGAWWVPVAALLSLLTLALLWQPLQWAIKARDTSAVLPLTIIVTLLVTPYTIGYDEVLLLLPFAHLWMLTQRSESGAARLLRYALLLWLTLLPLLQVQLVDLAQGNYVRIIQTLALLGLYYPITALRNEPSEELATADE